MDDEEKKHEQPVSNDYSDASAFLTEYTQIYSKLADVYRKLSINTKITLLDNLTDEDKEIMLIYLLSHHEQANNKCVVCDTVYMPSTNYKYSIYLNIKTNKISSIRTFCSEEHFNKQVIVTVADLLEKGITANNYQSV